MGEKATQPPASCRVTLMFLMHQNLESMEWSMALSKGESGTPVSIDRWGSQEKKDGGRLGRDESLV